MNHAYENGEMSLSLRQCIITCLPKGDKPRQFIKNWRPISLLSVIYKIGSSAIANRIKKFLGHVISPEQSGFISGRYIGDSTRLIYDLISIAEQKNIPGLLMLLDFEKAFDSISWNFLYSVLKLLGFGTNIIKLVQTFNINIKATIMQCGVMSSFINIEKGCHQGDPIAPYLFIICAQILNLMLKYNQSVRGIKVGNTEFRLTQFADDTTIILDGTRSSLVAALNMLEVYGSMSGLKVNTDKTKLIWIGKKRYCKDKFDIGKCLTWGVTEFDLLGVTFAVDLDKMIDLNYSNIVNKVEKELKKMEEALLNTHWQNNSFEKLNFTKVQSYIYVYSEPQNNINKRAE